MANTVAKAGGVQFAAGSLKPKIPGTLRCLVAEAVREFHMIGEGDKVLVGLSVGGERDREGGGERGREGVQMRCASFI